MLNVFRFIALLVVLSILSSFGSQNPLQEEGGVVPDQKTAIKLAEVILVRHFGEREVKAEMPFNVKLEGGVWKIKGTLSQEFVGGIFYIDIRQKDACVLQIGYPE